MKNKTSHFLFFLSLSLWGPVMSDDNSLRKLEGELKAVNILTPQRDAMVAIKNGRVFFYSFDQFTVVIPGIQPYDSRILQGKFKLRRLSSEAGVIVVGERERYLTKLASLYSESFNRVMFRHIKKKANYPIWAELEGLIKKELIFEGTQDEFVKEFISKSGINDVSIKFSPARKGSYRCRFPVGTSWLYILESFAIDMDLSMSIDDGKIITLQ